MAIIGLDENVYPNAYKSIGIVMGLYNFNSDIKINIIQYKFLKDMNLCTGRSLLGDRLVLSEKIMRYLENLDQNMLDGIIAHEISHVYNKDENLFIIILLLFGSPLLVFMITMLAIYLLSIGIKNDLALFEIFFACVIILWLGVRLATWFSIQDEYRSDRQAVFKTRNPDAVKKALQDYYNTNILINKRPVLEDQMKEFYFAIFYFIVGNTHPSLMDRIEYINYLKNNYKISESEE